MQTKHTPIISLFIICNEHGIAEFVKYKSLEKSLTMITILIPFLAALGLGAFVSEKKDTNCLS